LRVGSYGVGVWSNPDRIRTHSDGGIPDNLRLYIWASLTVGRTHELVCVLIETVRGTVLDRVGSVRVGRGITTRRVIRVKPLRNLNISIDLYCYFYIS
jgi:hypothetical protein